MDVSGETQVTSSGPSACAVSVRYSLEERNHFYRASDKTSSSQAYTYDHVKRPAPSVSASFSADLSL